MRRIVILALVLGSATLAGCRNSQPAPSSGQPSAAPTAPMAAPQAPAAPSKGACGGGGKA